MRISFAPLVVLVALFGCAVSPPPAPLPISTVVIDTALGPAKFRVEIAADEASRDYGLMNRKSMPANDGMLFDFHDPSQVTFWMKDTILPLDMLFIRADGTIANIKANAIPFSLVPIPAAEPVRAVLEINGGRAKALGIEPGEKVHNAIFANAR